jgi:hypothetical protein
MQCPEWDVYVIGGRSVYGVTDPGVGADRTGARVVGRWRSAAIQQARARARVQICWVWLDVDTAGTAPVGELAKLTKPPAHGMHAAAHRPPSYARP